MSAKAVTEQASTKVLIERWEQVSRKFAELAEALPVEKFDWAPVAGTRTCGEILRHVAFWNQYVTASVRRQNPDGSANELSAAEYPSKEKALAVLQSSAAEASAAVRQGRADLSAESMELAVSFIEHTSEHYGQLTVYARLMDVVPPRSR